mgnify:CR=1 FL=1
MGNWEDDVRAALALLTRAAEDLQRLTHYSDVPEFPMEAMRFLRVAGSQLGMLWVAIDAAQGALTAEERMDKLA